MRINRERRDGVMVSKPRLRFAGYWCVLVGGMIASGLWVSCASVSAEVYKWTDAEGRVHFGDQPPASGAEEVEIRTLITPPDHHVDERRRRQQKLLRSYDEDRTAQSQKQAKEDKKRRERESKCRHARKELERLRNSSYLFETDKSGERRIFSHEERAKAEKDWQDAVEYWCD